MAGMTGSRRSRRRRRGRLAEFETLEDRRLLSTLFADVNNATGVEDGSAAHPYHLIQTAIDHSAATGDTVSVAAGTYAEAVVVNKSIALLGSNAGINPTSGVRGLEAAIVPPVDNPYGGVNILVAASSVTIDGFAIDGHNAALGGGVLLNGVSVNAKSGVSNVDSTGFQYNISGLTVQNNAIRDFFRFGVIGDEDDFNGPGQKISSGNVIQNNLIDNMPTLGSVAVGSPGQGRGISIEDNFYARVSGNLITRAATGIQAIFDLAGDPAGFTSSIIGNEVHAYDRGILVYTSDTDTHVFDVSQNKVRAEQGVGTTATDVGIDLERVLSSTIVSVVNNDVSGFHVGIQVGYSPTTQGVTVSGGILSGNDIGVLLTNAGSFKSGAPQAVQATVVGVTISSSKTSGLEVADTLGQAVATVTLSVGSGTIVTGSPHGVILSGTYAKLAETIAPTIVLTSTPPAQSTTGTASFSFTASDNVSTTDDLTLTYKLDAGAWLSASSPISLTGLANGAHTMVVAATDQAGNKGTASYSWTVASPVVVQAPSLPKLDPSSDTGVSTSDGITRDNTPTFTGTAVAGLQVNISSGTTLLGQVKADSLGNWKFTVGSTGGTSFKTLSDGRYTITATAFDTAGNASLSSPALAITIDRTNPIVTVATSVLTPGIFGPPQVPVVFSGSVVDALSGPSDLSFSVRNSRGVVVASGTVTINADGTYRVMIMLNPAAKGASVSKRTYRLTFTAHDIAGNTGVTTGRFVIPAS